MSIRTVTSQTEDYIAQVDLYTTGDGPGTEVVGEGDYRARFLLARKGSAIPGKLARRLGIDEDFKLQPVQREAPKPKAPAASTKTVAPEEISTRETRPEKPEATR